MVVLADSEKCKLTVRVMVCRGVHRGAEIHPSTDDTGEDGMVEDP